VPSTWTAAAARIRWFPCNTFTLEYWQNSRQRIAHRGDMLPEDGKPVVTRITVEEVKEKG
jgi:hypothetical protein